jgi:hypothetical protein
MWLKKCKSYSLKTEEKRLAARLQQQKVLTKSYSVLDLPSQIKEYDKSFGVEDLPLRIKKNCNSFISFESQGTKERGKTWFL